MKVCLHNMETGEDTEVEVPALHQLRIILDGQVPGRGAKSRRILDLSGNMLYDADEADGERLGIHAHEGFIVALAPSSNDWVIGITG